MKTSDVPPRFVPDTRGRVRLRVGDTSFLAALTGLSVGHISRIISGERTATPEIRAKLERALGVPLERVSNAR